MAPTDFILASMIHHDGQDCVMEEGTEEGRTKDLPWPSTIKTPGTNVIGHRVSDAVPLPAIVAMYIRAHFEPQDHLTVVSFIQSAIAFHSHLPIIHAEFISLPPCFTRMKFDLAIRIYLMYLHASGAGDKYVVYRIVYVYANTYFVLATAEGGSSQIEAHEIQSDARIGTLATMVFVQGAGTSQGPL
ncbi:hypothetical protein CYLTODRAFT_415796 [Cylindrobasidium torrendii FP15055 ss-10]|uniref:Uncharacterized protein n=1 Tax=Cylindrobasidium torrendii FP15055 ss-10 TaxID=1314674 RepID=A0A0D7ASD7_9AGAR|nr:hypothetical protein CYLTODRAFT_415796 [Cylindrobasidium torrendii FP15055 ss-10]